ncbi:MAG: SpoIIE family protein phosphatase [Pseudomonadales bacterium]|nr:SpoIIE family protein phosphatase [Pseudomonadales bacterium]
MHILVVDNDRIQRQLVEEILDNKGHSYVSASDGNEALRILAEQAFEFVLLDVLLPDMDCFSLAEQIKQNHTDGSYLPIMFLSSVLDEATLVKCLQYGDDYLSRPFNSEVLNAKISVHNRIKTHHDGYAEYQAQTEKEQEIVAHMFNNAFSRNFVSTDRIRYHLSPMSLFNGDILMTALGPTGDTYVLLGDFTGHGLSAAIGGLPASRVFYAMTAKGLPLDFIVTELNRTLKQVLPPSMFMCGAIVQIDASGEYFKCWAGGSHDIQLVDAKGAVRQSIKSPHLALSILPEKSFRSEVDTVDIVEGDRLFMYTDGVLEATNENGEMFGEPRLLECISNNGAVRFGHDPLEYIADAVHDFTQNAQQEDDISIVEICLS